MRVPRGSESGSGFRLGGRNDNSAARVAIQIRIQLLLLTNSKYMYIIYTYSKEPLKLNR